MADEYDFEAGPEDEVMRREADKAMERWANPPAGIVFSWVEVVAPLVRALLALLAALGARSLREARERAANPVRAAIDEDDRKTAERWAMAHAAECGYVLEEMALAAQRIEIAAMLPLVREARQARADALAEHSGAGWAAVAQIGKALGLGEDASTQAIVDDVRRLAERLHVEMKLGDTLRRELDAARAEVARLKSALGEAVMDIATWLRSCPDEIEAAIVMPYSPERAARPLGDACDYLATAIERHAALAAVESPAPALAKDSFDPYAVLQAVGTELGGHLPSRDLTDAPARVKHVVSELFAWETGRRSIPADAGETWRALAELVDQLIAVDRAARFLSEDAGEVCEEEAPETWEKLQAALNALDLNEGTSDVVPRKVRGALAACYAASRTPALTEEEARAWAKTEPVIAAWLECFALTDKQFKSASVEDANAARAARAKALGMGQIVVDAVREVAFARYSPRGMPAEVRAPEMAVTTGEDRVEAEHAMLAQTRHDAATRMRARLDAMGVPPTDKDAPDSVDPRDLPPDSEEWVERAPGLSVHQPRPERPCVAVLVTDSAGRVLLVHSNKGGDRAWEIPGGKREDGEPAPDAARREFREETGLIVTLDEGEPVALPPSARHRGALLFRGRAEGEPKAGSDADAAAWWTAHAVLDFEKRGMLSDLASRNVLLAWAREMAGAAPQPPSVIGDVMRRTIDKLPHGGGQ